MRIYQEKQVREQKIYSCSSSPLLATPVLVGNQSSLVSDSSLAVHPKNRDICFASRQQALVLVSHSTGEHGKNSRAYKSKDALKNLSE